MKDANETIVRRSAVAVGGYFVMILAVAVVSLAFCPVAWAGAAEGRITASTTVPSYEKLAAGPWRGRPVQGKPFWFRLGGGDDSPAHIATLKERPIADAGLASHGVAEWGYSFHHLKNGAPDGAGNKHYGGYPQPPRTRAEAAEVVKAYFNRLAADARVKAKPHELRLFSPINGHYCYQHYACEWGAAELLAPSTAVATEHDLVAVVRCLLEAGVKVHTRDPSGWTPFLNAYDLASKWGKREVAEFLKSLPGFSAAKKLTP